MTNGIARAAMTLASMSLLAGCAALNGTHYAWPGPGDSQVITVDAKQRHLLMANRPSHDQDGGWNYRACAEAAPDIFTATSSGFDGFLGLGPSDEQAKAAGNIAEAAAMIPRTQTINLLRESMYRTCERWLSGALTQEQFVVQAARDQRMMISVLAVEQLTGYLGVPVVSIDGKASTTSGADPAVVLKLTEQYKTAWDSSLEEVGKADKAYADAGGDAVCKADPVADDKKAACTAATVAQADAKAKEERTRSQHDTVLATARQMADAMSRSSESDATVTTGTANRVSDEAIIKLADTVLEITRMVQIDEPLMFCIAYLGRDRSPVTYNGQTRERPNEDAIVASCNSIVRERATVDKDIIEKLMLPGS